MRRREEPGAVDELVVPGARTADLTIIPGIETLVELRDHLQWAIEVEHTTIPSYLCALYSMDPARNPAAAEVLRSVVLEEMLHLALAANLLNAVGGRPELDSPRLLPGYPRPLPHRDPPLTISLLPFGEEAIDLFLQIERPCTPDAPPQADQYATIAQFYAAIRSGLVELTAELGEAAVFCGDAGLQVVDEHSRGGPGRIFAITGIETALRALDLIVEQGEGAAHVEVWDGDCDMFHPERHEVGHYYRFVQLQVGRRFRRGDTPSSGPTGEPIEVDWDAVLPARGDQRTADLPPGSTERAAMDEFNRTYCVVLEELEAAFDGEPAMLGQAISTMFRLRDVAEALMRTDSGAPGRTLGPSFEYVPRDAR